MLFRAAREIERESENCDRASPPSICRPWRHGVVESQWKQLSGYIQESASIQPSRYALLTIGSAESNLCSTPGALASHPIFHLSGVKIAFRAHCYFARNSSIPDALI